MPVPSPASAAATLPAPGVHWFDSAVDLVHWAQPALPAMFAAEDALTAAGSHEAFCVSCQALRPMAVFGGAMLGEFINLREGLVCMHCGLNARSRLLLQVAGEVFPDAVAKLALLEAFTPLARALKKRRPATRLSEYFGAGVAPGTFVQQSSFHGVPWSARHEDMMALGYADGLLDGIVHNDVLEHVPDVDAALAELLRVLRPGGSAVFTMPWFPWLEQTLVRGRLGADGALQELLPAEYHGDGLRAEGIYTFYNFGADLGARILAAGFASVRYAVCYDLASGLTSNNYRYGTDGLMLASVLVARRGP